MAAILCNPANHLQKFLKTSNKSALPLKIFLPKTTHQSPIFHRNLSVLNHQNAQFGTIASEKGSAVVEHQRPPGLMIPGVNCFDNCRLRYFLSSPLGKDINQEHYLPLLTVFHSHLIRGSYQGWLAVVNTKLAMYLLNPFSGTRINLPPVTQLPNPPCQGPKTMGYVRKVILSASPSSSECMAVAFYGPQIAFCKLGDKDWIIMKCPPPLGYIDGVFDKGLFHVVTHHGNVFTCDLSADEPKMVKVDPQPKEIQSEQQKWYLVEAGGELVRILRKVKVEKEDEESSGSEEDNSDDSEDDSDDSDSDDDSDEESEGENNSKNHRTDILPYKYQTTQFEVDKLDCSGTKAEWRKVDKLDGYAIFLGLNQSFSIPGSQISGYKGNRIYFTDDNVIAHKNFKRSGYDIGSFNLQDSTFEPIYKADSESTKPPAVWLTPQLW